jgi:transcription repressor
MRDGMVVKRHYGKIYLTDRGAFTVNYYRRLLDATLAAMPEYPFPVSADERRNAALALIAALPDRDYREHFGALFAETEVEENEPQPESE